MGVGRVAVLVVVIGVVWGFFLRTQPVPENLIKGGCSTKFRPVENAYRANFANGWDRGSSFSLYHKGEIVCDLWGGYQDESNLYPWQSDTMSIFFSATKGICALCLILLSDRGHIDFKQPVAKYWPEFAQNGKGDITVQQLLSHQAGLAAIDDNITFEMIRDDVKGVGRALEKQAPNWSPGSTSGYHMLTFGLYVEQLVLRVDPKHRRIDEFFREEVAEPYDIDFHIGLPYMYHHRVASFTEPSALSGLLQMLCNDRAMFWIFLKGLFVSDPIYDRAAVNPSASNDSEGMLAYNWPISRTTPQGSANGYGTARGMAKLYGILASGGSSHGKQLLSSKSFHLLDEVVISGIDRIIKLPLTWGNGLMVFKGPGRSTMFGHVGYGGQLGFGNIENQLGLGFHSTTMFMTLYDGDPRFTNIRNAIHDSLPTFKP